MEGEVLGHVREREGDEVNEGRKVGGYFGKFEYVSWGG